VYDRKTDSKLAVGAHTEIALDEEMLIASLLRFHVLSVKIQISCSTTFLI